MMFVILLLWHEDHNRMADLMIAAEVHFYRLGVPIRKLDCHSQWQIKLIDCIQFLGVIMFMYSISNMSTHSFDSKITIWYRAVFVISPLVYRFIFTICFTQEVMLLYRRFGLLNTVLQKLLNNERAKANNSNSQDLNKWLN